MKVETIPDSVVVAPPAGVAAATIAGVPLQDWVLWLNLAFILLALGWKLRTIFKEYRDGRK